MYVKIYRISKKDISYICRTMQFFDVFEGSTLTLKFHSSDYFLNDTEYFFYKTL